MRSWSLDATTTVTICEHINKILLLDVTLKYRGIAEEVISGEIRALIANVASLRSLDKFDFVLSTNLVFLIRIFKVRSSN
jgi:hypothetical protein